jgi:N-acetylglucosaminyldiphosphoundecaprenol N-acetyl-beta-D-mannosaminyltransferase
LNLRRADVRDNFLRAPQMISIVTVVRNDLDGLKRTYRSLPPPTAEADYEWVVVDGASQDGASRWLSGLRHQRLLYRSEPDDGIYDAMNIGTSMASGEYVLFLNAGDELADPSTLRKLEERLARSSDLAYGDAFEVDSGGRQRLRPARAPDWIGRGMFTHHQAMLFRRTLLLKGGYRTRYRFSADYDLVARWVVAGATTQYLGLAVARYSLGGHSDVGRRKAIREDSQIRKEVLSVGFLRRQGLAVGHLVHLGAKRLFPSAVGRWRSFQGRVPDASVPATMAHPSRVVSVPRSTPSSRSAGATLPGERLVAAGTALDIVGRLDVLEEVARRLSSTGRPLVLASSNLDHLTHFGVGGSFPDPALATGDADWLVTADGMPLVWWARRRTRGHVNQLAGSDLLPQILEAAETIGASVGFIGGWPEHHDRLTLALSRRFPDLRVAGCWAPSRDDLRQEKLQVDLAREIASQGVQLLVVGLGKPRQEVWLSQFIGETESRVALAFGAASEFLAGSTPRAPEQLRRVGLEWLYRLVREPRRLWRRYLLEGPRALSRLLGSKG